MKWMLFVVLSTGASPMTPEHHVSEVIAFDDRLMCEGFLHDLRNRMRSRWRVDLGFCFPPSSTQLEIERRKGYEETFPQHAK